MRRIDEIEDKLNRPNVKLAEDEMAEEIAFGCFISLLFLIFISVFLCVWISIVA